MILDRRSVVALVLGATIGAAHARPPASAKEPKDIVDWIYTQTIRSIKSPGKPFSVFQQENMSVFSKAFRAEYQRAQKAADKAGDMLIDVDPVTNSQDPDLKSFTTAVGTQDEKSAVVSASFANSGGAKQEVQYLFVRDGADWKIDDIRSGKGAGASSLRKMFKSQLKTR